MKEFSAFRLDTINQCLWRRNDGRDDERIILKPKPFAVLKYLVGCAGRLVTQDELLETLWPDTYVQPEVLKRHILEIRTVLGDDAKNPVFIETLPRRGCRFIASIQDDIPPVPEIPLKAATDRVVGRDRAFAELRESLLMATAGSRQTVFITGEPGIGKTTLVDEFVRQATGAAAVRLACGQCLEGYGGKEPY